MTTFKKGDIVTHRKNPDRRYLVVIAADAPLVIEGSNVSGYAYRDLTTGITWVRPMSEMEDGRFSLIQSDRAASEEKFPKECSTCGYSPNCLCDQQ
jgi:hypothetical protein